MALSPQLITSPANARIKAVARLRQRGRRDGRGLMIVEEPLVIARGLEAGLTPREVYFCREHLAATDEPLLKRVLAHAGVTACELSPPAMARIAYRDQPQGLLVVADRPGTDLDSLELPPGEPALVVVLEAVEKPGNLGAVQRVADGAGAHAVITCGGGVDPWNPNALRASRGACFAVPTVETDPAVAVTWLRERGIGLVAASPEGEALHHGVALTGPVAILLGTEHDGLSRALLAEADTAVRIPMLGTGDSLNVATSAAVLLYEARRQRVTD